MGLTVNLGRSGIRFGQVSATLWIPDHFLTMTGFLRGLRPGRIQRPLDRLKPCISDKTEQNPEQ